MSGFAGSSGLPPANPAAGLERGIAGLSAALLCLLRRSWMQARKKIFPICAHVEKGPQENIMSSCFKGPSERHPAAKWDPSHPSTSQDLINQDFVAVALVHVHRDYWYRGRSIISWRYLWSRHCPAPRKCRGVQCRGEEFPGRMWNKRRSLGIQPESTKQGPAFSRPKSRGRFKINFWSFYHLKAH